MSATVTVGGGTSNPFSVRNGSRQWCTIAPALFILYFGLVLIGGLVDVKWQVWKCSLKWVGS